MSGRYDEHDQEHYERPRRHTRPRTKERPTLRRRRRRHRHHRGPRPVHPRGRRARRLGGQGPAPGPQGGRGRRPGAGRRRRVGRRRHAGPDRRGTPERTTVLRRTADDDDPVERVLVANADQLVVVTALADPEPRPRLIDRALVAAFDAGMRPAAVPDQGRPRRPGDAAGDLPLPRACRGSSPSAEATWASSGSVSRAARAC